MGLGTMVQGPCLGASGPGGVTNRVMGQTMIKQ